MIKPKIKPDLLALLTSGKFDAFTSPELTLAYFTLPGCTSTSERTASQIVGRVVRTLKASELIEVNCGDNSKGNGKSPQYQLSDGFYRLFECAPTTVGKPTSAVSGTEYIDKLKKKLNDYKVAL